MPLSSTSFFKEAVLPAEGTVSTAEPRALVFFLGRLVWQRASKWACMGASMDRKLHCRKPLSVGGHFPYLPNTGSRYVDGNYASPCCHISKGIMPTVLDLVCKAEEWLQPPSPLVQP